MAQHKFKTEWQINQAGPVTGALERVAAVDSPARILQQLLEEQRGHSPEVQVERWSQRRAMGFIVMSAGSLWMALLFAGAQVAKAVA